jgi:hypothetical protein
MKPGAMLSKLFAKGPSAGSVPKGCTPITQFNEQDIFIAGYPKSGNTWFQELVSAVVYGVDPALCPPSLFHELVPDVHYKDFYQRYQTPMFFKTHNTPRPEYKRVVHLLRDGRDVMTSFFHHNAALAAAQTEFLEMVRDGKNVGSSKWHEHTRSWLENPYGAVIITIKYEDLVENAAREMFRFCEFAGIVREPAFVERMAAATAFEKMQSREARERIYVEPRWPKDKLFRRKGKVGSYKEDMPPEVLRAFLAQSAATLRQCGYAVDV